jgi:hypothetical protein
MFINPKNFYKNHVNKVQQDEKMEEKTMEEENLFIKEDTISETEQEEEESATYVKQPTTPIRTAKSEQQTSEFEQPNFDPEKMNDVAPAESGIKKILPKEDYGKRIFTIKKVTATRIALIDENCEKIPPLKGKGGGLSYKVKMKILFEEEDLCEYYPSLRYWVADNKISSAPSVPRIEVEEIEEKENDHFTPEVAKIFAKYTRHTGKKSKEISDKEFFLGMIGKKVKLKNTSGVYEKKPWQRNDIIDFF